jgi:hypothetical protein
VWVELEQLLQEILLAIFSDHCVWNSRRNSILAINFYQVKMGKRPVLPLLLGGILGFWAGVKNILPGK